MGVFYIEDSRVQGLGILECRVWGIGILEFRV